MMLIKTTLALSLAAFALAAPVAQAEIGGIISAFFFSQFALSKFHQYTVAGFPGSVGSGQGQIGRAHV